MKRSIQESIEFLEMMRILVDHRYCLQAIEPFLSPPECCYKPDDVTFYHVQLEVLDQMALNLPNMLVSIVREVLPECQKISFSESKNLMVRMEQFSIIFKKWADEVKSHQEVAPLNQKIHRFLREYQTYRRQIIALQEEDSSSFTFRPTDSNEMNVLSFVYNKMDLLVEGVLFSFATPLIRHLEERELLREPAKVRVATKSKQTKKTEKQEKRSLPTSVRIKRPPPQLNDLIASLLPAIGLTTHEETARIYSLIDLHLSLTVLKVEPMTYLTVRSIFSKYAAFLEQAATLKRTDGKETEHDLTKLLTNLTAEEMEEVSKLKDVVAIISRYHYRPHTPLGDLLEKKEFDHLKKEFKLSIKFV